MTESGISPNECQLPCDTEPAHICLPLYRAADGAPTRCWCGADCRDVRLHDLHARLAESVRLLDGTSNVIDMAAARRRRAR
jgi:hypothetical protein